MVVHLTHPANGRVAIPYGEFADLVTRVAIPFDEFTHLVGLGEVSWQFLSVPFELTGVRQAAIFSYAEEILNDPYHLSSRDLPGNDNEEVVFAWRDLATILPDVDNIHIISPHDEDAHQSQTVATNDNAVISPYFQYVHRILGVISGLRVASPLLVMVLGSAYCIFEALPETSVLAQDGPDAAFQDAVQDRVEVMIRDAIQKAFADRLEAVHHDSFQRFVLQADVDTDIVMFLCAFMVFSYVLYVHILPRARAVLQ